MKLYGHPWSINTRKVLMALAEKGQEAELSLVMIPKGEQKLARHVALHPFGKVPVIDDEGFVLYESGAINRYLERKFPSPALVPSDARGAALVDQWISACDAYFSPQAGPLLVETLFRRYLGGATDGAVVASAREKMQTALDAIDRQLGANAYLAGETFSLADIHFMPYLEYLVKTGQDEPLQRRTHLSAWWERESRRPAWQKAARSGPQPYESGMSAEVIERRYRA
ncbi:MAG TPA: glutathione S-transferase N-terminal domain-containing protein [Polyangiaceae bacterium]